MQQPPETTRAHEKATGSGNQESQLGNCFAISHKAKTTVDGPKNKNKKISEQILEVIIAAAGGSVVSGWKRETSWLQKSCCLADPLEKTITWTTRSNSAYSPYLFSEEQLVLSEQWKGFQVRMEKLLCASSQWLKGDLEI